MKFTSETTFEALIFFGALISLYVLVLGHRIHLARKSGLKSPFVEDILRLPGHSARLHRSSIFDELAERYNQFLLYSVMLIFSALFINSLLSLVSLVVAIFGVSSTMVKAWKLFDKIQEANLVCDGEEYTGQELNYLSSEGAFVYHDIPYSGGNIDHIVIGNDKVFVVETCTVNKDPSSNIDDSKASSTVEFDGDNLKFPSSVTADPIVQAKRHSKYLKSQIFENCDLKFQVMPVVAIPGWHVNITSRSKAGILIINPKRGTGLKAWLGSRNNLDARKAVHEYLSSVARSIPPRSKKTEVNASEDFDFWLNPRYKTKVLRD